MTLKKILSLTLALCMSAACLTACGSSDESDSAETSKLNVADQASAVLGASADSEADDADDDNIDSTDDVDTSSDANNNTDTADDIPYRVTLPVEERLALMETAVLQKEAENGDWKYNVYDSYVELTEYLGEQVEEFIIPDEIDGLPVWVYNCYNTSKNDITTSLKLPDELLYIGDNAFDHFHALENINFPDGLVQIGMFSFADSPNLKSLDFPDGLNLIGTCAFRACLYIDHLTIPSSVEWIGEGAFQGQANCSGYTRAKGIEFTVLNPDYNFDYDLGGTIEKLYGYAGSTAEEYAAEHNIPFEAID